MSEAEATLRVEQLSTHFHTREGVVKAVEGVSFEVRRGRILGIAGESGSGKSVTAYSILRLLVPPGRIVAGRVLFAGEDLVTVSDARMRQIRGARIAIIFQDPSAALNPVLRVDTQLVEAVTAHRPGAGRREARRQVLEALELVGMPDPERRLLDYPHQLSGGMRQRLAIAMAMLHEPELIIADEPTTALDVTLQSQVLYEIDRLCRRKGTSLIWITHDLAVLAALADDICVMYAGRVVEQGAADEVLDRPLHPYTAGLIRSLPERSERGKPLFQVPGMTPSLLDPGPGCAFQARCIRAAAACREMPPLRHLGPERAVRCVNPVSGPLHA